MTEKPTPHTREIEALIASNRTLISLIDSLKQLLEGGKDPEALERIQEFVGQLQAVAAQITRAVESLETGAVAQRIEQVANLQMDTWGVLRALCSEVSQTNRSVMELRAELGLPLREAGSGG